MRKLRHREVQRSSDLLGMALSREWKSLRLKPMSHLKVLPLKLRQIPPPPECSAMSFTTTKIYKIPEGIKAES